MMTVLADCLGVISVSAYGVRSKKSKNRVRVFSCCDFVLSKKNGDIYRLEQSDLVDGFYPVCEDIVKLSLANYICNLAKDAFGEGDRNVLSLLLNAMYVISYKETDIELVKAAYELKLSQYMGYEPHIECCSVCGNAEEIIGFDISGGVKCKGCMKPGDIDMSAGAYAAIRYILQKRDTKIFAFEATDAVKNELSRISEKYISEKSERSYKSLEYFKKMM